MDEDGTDIIINIAEGMFAEEIAPAPGVKQKFDLVEAPELVQGLPALCINLDKARKTKTITVSYPKKKDDQPDPKGSVNKTQGPENNTDTDTEDEES